MTTTLCNKPTCQNPKAEDSVCCVFHRDQKKQLNQDWRDRKRKGLPKRKPGRKPAGTDALEQLEDRAPTRGRPAKATPGTLGLEEAIEDRKQKIDKLTLEITMLEGALEMLRA
jgi:hypothetical protein